MIKRIFTTLPFAYVLFRFYLVAFNSSIQKALLFVVLVLYVAKYFFSTTSKRERNDFMKSLLIFGFILVAGIFIVLATATLDFSYVRKLATHALDILCWVVFVIHVKRKSNDKNILETFVDEFCFIVAMYIGFTILCIMIPQLREGWQSIVSFSSSELMNLHYSKYVGRIGWDGFAGYTATFMCSLGVFFCIACLNNKEVKVNSYIKKSTLFIYIGIMLVGNVFYGRTGLIVSVLLIFLFLMKTAIIDGEGKFLFTIVGIVIFLFIGFIILKSHVPVLNSLYEWAFEPVLNYFENDEISSTSLSVLIEMWHVPPIETILWGEGYYTDPATGLYYRSIDVGFLRLIYYWGIIPTIIVYMATLKSLKRSIMYDNFLFLLFCLIFVLFEAKGEIYKTILIIFSTMTLLGSNGKRRRIKFVLGR